MVTLHATFLNFEDAVALLSVTDSSGILTIEKKNGRPHADKFLGLEKILMSVKVVDDCEIKATVNNPYPWQNKHFFCCVM